MARNGCSFRLRQTYALPPLVYGRTADGGWQLMAWVPGPYNDIPSLEADTLLEQPPTAAASRWWQLGLGGQQFPIIDGRPKQLDRTAQPVSVPTGP